MSVQHEFRGSGNPNDLAVVAEVNSHYFDESTGKPWWCIWHDPVEGASEWAELALQPYPASIISGTLILTQALETKAVIQSGITIRFDYAGTVYSNVALAGTPRTYTATQLSLVELQLADDGLILTVTPLTQY